MAVITPNTFDPLRRYVGVRLQQGVPIVDADWNELDDLLRFEFRAFLRWFVGSGVPAGSDAFRVEGTALANDFFIRRGVTGGPGANVIETGLRFAGQCLVDGYALRIPADLRFSDQPLHESHGAAADAEAARLGVPKIKAMVAPVGNFTLAAYVDGWERLVTPAEDPSLVLGAIGTESCARMKREWAVRVRDGSTVPAPVDPDFIVGHGYFLLALIARTNGQANVNAADVTDMRVTNLSLADVLTRVGKIERLTLLPTFNPSPNQFFPKTGPVGQLVTLTGRNFNLGTVGVAFGATNAVLAGPPTATQIQANVPAIAAGAVKITVTTEGGTTTSVDSFTVI